MPNQTMDVSARTLVYGHSSLLGMMDSSGQRKTFNSLHGLSKQKKFYSLKNTIYLNKKPTLSRNIKSNKETTTKNIVNSNPTRNVFHTSNLLQQTERTMLDDEDDNDSEENEEISMQTLTELLQEYKLLIKYKKGCEITNKMKTNLKKGAYNRFVKFKQDSKLKISPSYYLDGELTFFKGYLTKELLRFNILKQLSLWAEQESEESEESEESVEENEENEENEDKNEVVEEN
jgi:hypothetical protein